MATFRDAAGRDWPVSITVWHLRLVREATGFELGRLLDENMRRLAEVARDPELLCRVLFCLCGEAARTRGVAEEEFFRSVCGDTLKTAFDAFMGAYADFCPSQQADPLRALLAKERELAARLSATATARLAGIDAAALAEELATSNGSAGGSPGSAASTPAG